jgi:hypothetical protein
MSQRLLPGPKSEGRRSLGASPRLRALWSVPVSGYEIPTKSMATLGLGGKELHDDWAKRSYSSNLGLTVAGFPNMFLTLGPYTALGEDVVVGWVGCAWVGWGWGGVFVLCEGSWRVIFDQALARGVLRLS